MSVTKPMKNSLQDQILKEVEKSGFPFELKVANEFKRKTWRLKYNTYYIDLDEKKGREIDLIASYTHTAGPKNRIQLSFDLIIEVKQETKKPWVFFSTECTNLEKIVGLPTIRQDVNFGYNVMLVIRKHRQQLSSRLARSFYEGTKATEGPDKIFKSLCSCVKALEHRCSSNTAEWDVDGAFKLFCLYEPVIVFRGEMFDAYLDMRGKIKLEEANYLQVAFNYMSPNYKTRMFGYVVHVVKETKLDAFIKNKQDEFDAIANAIIKETQSRIS